MQRGLVLKLIAATVPAIIIGIIVRKPVQHLFASPSAASLFLIANAGLLLLGERMRGRSGRRGENLSYTDAVIIGLFQCLAFLPGISRSGAAIIGGLRRGISHERAAKFAFLMGTPVIFAASLVEIPKLLHGHELHSLFGTALIAAMISGAVAFASTAFLMRYFRDHDAWALKPFAYYCGVFGAVSFALLTVGL
jgi:undecaprenyl-diphosphatase